MVILKLGLMIFFVVFLVSAFFGLVGFLHDVFRYPQKHEKVKIIPSAETPEEPIEKQDGLVLDETISIFGDNIENKIEEAAPDQSSSLSENTSCLFNDFEIDL